MDTSALMAIVLAEPEREAFRRTMLGADSLKMSVANWLEASLVVQGTKQPALIAELDKLVATFGIDLVAVDMAQARLARAAGQRFGRKHHRAELNYGDCFAYALSKATGEPLLYKGNDFAQTDVTPAPRA